MTILYCVKNDDNHLLLNAIKRELPDEQFDVWPSCKNPDEITTAIVWAPPADLFDSLPKLQTVLSMSAGVDNLLGHPGLRPEVSVVRLQDAGMGTLMSEYVLYGTLMAHRKMHQFALGQSQKKWLHETTCKNATDFHVGILGAGILASQAAARLISNGYRVSTWSRTEKRQSKVQSFFGEEQLELFLSDLDAIVCLLPLTNATIGILDKRLFHSLPKGAFLINPGRGQQLVEPDLLEALDSGQLSGAMLDVFAVEPLPQNHPYWEHPRIVITPHLAAETVPEESAKQIRASIEAIKRGEPPAGLVDRVLGY